jgi:peptidoglycan hydrolase-like protein with peptidoglycan-binding domain
MRRRKAAGWIVGGLALLVAGAGIGWAAATVLTPPKDALQTTPFTYVKVVNGSVGSWITLNTVAGWSLVPVGSNLASGTVTTVNVEPGQEVVVGSVLYTVNLRPVVLAQGNVPAFQSLSRGSSGTDVAQLQTMLANLGFYDYGVDGTFDSVTERAVESWQESLGLEGDGNVQVGDIIYVPTLPTRVSLDTDKVKRGATLGGGEEVVRGLPPSPIFTVPVTATQAGLMPISTRVEISGPNEQSWEGFVVEQLPSTKDDSVTLTLGGTNGKPVCGEECASIPVSGQALLRSRVVTIEEVEGLTIPSAALLSKADGSLVVIDKDDTEYPVTVITSARGMSVIEGVTLGMNVRVPAK